MAGEEGLEPSSTSVLETGVLAIKLLSYVTLADANDFFRILRIYPNDQTRAGATLHAVRLMAAVVGLEPTECRSQSPVPYHLATPQYWRG